jgi:dethiobiotin synthetase/adenosylmethionine--8-amino-7-oxononanoate aminotransferase
MAGGVHSPGISGSLQADIMRSLRLPVILVGDSKLGGISSTLTAFESLKLRGFEIPFIIMFNTNYKNHEIIKNNTDSKVIVIEQPPSKLDDSQLDLYNMRTYVQRICQTESFNEFYIELIEYQKKRLRVLNELQYFGSDLIWWPFTQHEQVKNPIVIDSAYEDHYDVFDPVDTELSFKSYFDGCASWWTQGLGHGNPKLALTAGYAAGRYGHVIAAETVHEPAYFLAKELLDTAGAGWADRVFYSDNGSTAVEVAIKMAIGTATKNLEMNNESIEWSVIGLQGSYHGDTIGAMDLSDPNIFNNKVHWYKGKGFWFNPPTVELKDEYFHICFPDECKFHVSSAEKTFKSFKQVFFSKRPETRLLYREFIIQKLKEQIKTKNFGALVMEPLILGAGGMIFVDPLFQKELINVVRNPHWWNSRTLKIPVVFDEVFVGMYRLGKTLPSVSSLFNSNEYLPDIACYAKCLTGGLLPLAVTLATKEIFDVFRGNSKIQALLHGHSYTAHPVGCMVALESLKQYRALQSEIQANEWFVWDEKVYFFLNVESNIII